MAGPRPSFALAFAAYSALQLLLFVVPLLVVYAVSGNALLSAVIAAVVGLALSMILLDRQRGLLAKGLRERSESRRRITDEALEDQAVDEAEDQNDSAAANPRP